MSGQGSISLEKKGEDYILTLKGVIDERCKFPEELPSIGQRLIFECRSVDMVNSIGISQWFNWMRKLDPKQQIVFRNCARKVVDIINYLDGFLTANAVVESFIVPYECMNCGHEQEDLLERGKHFLEAGPGRAVDSRVPEHINCSQCGEQMEAAVLLKNYLRFLNLYNATQE